jgi:ketosteroid isomerase-like protein
MRYHGIVGAALCAMLAAGSAAQAQPIDPQITAPITRFLEAFNKGDVAGAAATHASGSDLVIIDEVAPYMWRGAKAFDAWLGDLDRDSKAKGITDQQVALGKVTRVETDGAWAYVVVPSVYTFKEKGVAMREQAQMTFALKKDPAGWSIHGWTWTGPRAQKAAAAAK